MLDHVGGNIDRDISDILKRATRERVLNSGSVQRFPKSGKEA